MRSVLLLACLVACGGGGGSSDAGPDGFSNDAIATSDAGGDAETTDGGSKPFEGYGANATCGANVVHVTNTKTSGSGSFADAIASPGNHVVFDVSGTIDGTFYVPSSTCVDGFSAPSPGVVFTGGTGSAGVLNLVDVHDVVVQGVRVRGSSGMPDNTKGIMLFENQGTNHDIVIDHCEIENVTDEDIGSSGHDVTISWNLLGAPASSGGNLIKYDSYHWSVHHNLWVGFTGNDSRVPLVWAGNDSTKADTWAGQTVADVVGNVVSQFLYGITYVNDGADADPSNILNNFLDGQDSDHARSGIDIMASKLETHFLAGNASVLTPVGTPSSYSCGASNVCGTFALSSTNQLDCGAISGCQLAAPVAMPPITTSCSYDAAARISEWNDVIAHSGVATHFADDAPAAALRAVVTAPTPAILAASWNKQSGSCP